MMTLLWRAFILAAIVQLCSVIVVYSSSSDFEELAFSEETHDMLCTNALTSESGTNMPWFLNVIHDGIFTVNITAMRQYYAAGDGDRTMDFMDVRLVGRNPVYFAAAREASMALIEHLPPLMRDPSSPIAALVEMMEPPLCIDSSAGRILRGTGGSGSTAGTQKGVEAAVYSRYHRGIRDTTSAPAAPASPSAAAAAGMRKLWFEWCLLPAPCTARGRDAVEGEEASADESEHLCRIKVNPLHDYCIVLPKLVRPVNPDSKAAGAVVAVSYEVTVPALGSTWVFEQLEVVGRLLVRSLHQLVSFIDANEKAGVRFMALIDQAVAAANRGDVPHCLRAVALLPLTLVRPVVTTPEVVWVGQQALQLVRSLPTYVVCALCSARIYSGAAELAESVVLQSLLMMTSGIALGAVTLLFVLYSTVQQMIPLPRSVTPFVSSSLLGLGVLLPAALIGRSAAYFLLRHVVVQYLVEFWNNGVFGVSWLGKAYIGLYAVGAVGIMRWFRLFSEDSISRWVLAQTIRALGLYVLAVPLLGEGGDGTSGVSTSSSLRIGNVEVCGLVMLLICTYDWCCTSLPSWYVTIVGQYFQKPTIKYSGRRRLTDEEYEAEGRDYTAQALKDLRKQLASNPTYTARLSDRLYRDGKYLQSNMLKRFANGDYKGLPPGASVVYAGAPRGWMEKGWGLLLFVVPVAMAAGAAAAYATATYWLPQR